MKTKVIEVELGEGDVVSLKECWLKSYVHLKHSFKNESILQKWKHISKMKAHFKNGSIFRKWKHILKMKAHSKNEFSEDDL